MTLDTAETANPKTRFVRVIEFAFSLFLRLLAVVFFVATIYTWMQAIGYWEGANYRFDTMELALKIYTAIMVVMLPVASVGLWTTLPWGRVLWFLAIGFQSVSIVRFPDLFLAPFIVLTFHLSCLVLYVIFQLLLHFIAKKE